MTPAPMIDSRKFSDALHPHPIAMLLLADKMMAGMMIVTVKGW